MRGCHIIYADCFFAIALSCVPSIKFSTLVDIKDRIMATESLIIVLSRKEVFAAKEYYSTRFVFDGGKLSRGRSFWDSLDEINREFDEVDAEVIDYLRDQISKEVCKCEQL